MCVSVCAIVDTACKCALLLAIPKPLMCCLAMQQVSSSVPPTSYRQGVKSAPLHNLYAPTLTAALRAALARFERNMPGLICDDAVLYGAETRTSSPVRFD